MRLLDRSLHRNNTSTLRVRNIFSHAYILYRRSTKRVRNMITDTNTLRDGNTLMHCRVTESEDRVTQPQLEWNYCVKYINY